MTVSKTLWAKRCCREQSAAQSWVKLEKNFEANERVDGVIFGRVRWFHCRFDGATAFCRAAKSIFVRDITPLMNTQPFQI